LHSRFLRLERARGWRPVPGSPPAPWWSSPPRDDHSPPVFAATLAAFELNFLKMPRNRHARS
jgi:hypothetical protein